MTWEVDGAEFCCIIAFLLMVFALYMNVERTVDSLSPNAQVSREVEKVEATNGRMAANAPTLDAFVDVTPSHLANGAHLKGHPVQVVKSTGNNTFELEIQALEGILCNEIICNKHVAVVSVTGAFRKGKSFILNFFIHYLEKQRSLDWVLDENVRLEGFSWRRGSQRETTGIWLWSEPFPVDTPHGTVVVLLMDTQGIFDCESTIKEYTSVFALSTMLSSVQVYNIMSNIQEDHLQHLQLFAEYGRLAANNNETTPFQRLAFLIRDWILPEEHDYGTEGGQELLDKRFKLTKDQPTEIRNLRADIMECFDRVGCFLMPHPGKKVTRDKDFNGNLSDIDEEFKEQLGTLLPWLLSPKNLTAKKIQGKPITGIELMEYAKKYIEIFQGDNLPEPKSIWKATAEAGNMSAISRAKTEYEKIMKAECVRQEYCVAPNQLELEHQNQLEAALNLFDTLRMGGDAFSQEYRTQLETEIGSYYQTLKGSNDKTWQRTVQTYDAAAANASAFYKRNMEQECDKSETCMGLTTLERYHRQYKDDAMEQFDNHRMGGDELLQKYKRQLITNIEKVYDDIKELDGKKPSFNKYVEVGSKYGFVIGIVPGAVIFGAKHGYVGALVGTVIGCLLGCGVGAVIGGVWGARFILKKIL